MTVSFSYTQRPVSTFGFSVNGTCRVNPPYQVSQVRAVLARKWSGALRFEFGGETMPARLQKVG